MPDPREAVYDVLKAKWQREKEAEEVAAKLRETGHSIEEWNQANERARAAARQRR